MLVCRAVLALAAAGCALVAPAAVDAATRTTHWYTINVTDPPPQSQASGSTIRFVGNGNFAPGNYVTMQQYEPNNKLQHWTLVYRTWPAGPETTSSGPDIAGFLKCGATGILGAGCAFSNVAGQPFPPMKLVNRGSGLCMTVLPGRAPANGARVVQDNCAGGGDLMNRQSWYGYDPADPGPETDGKPAKEIHLEQRTVKPSRCLNFPEPDRSLNVRSPCYAVWFQSFRFLRVASMTCEVPVGYRICGGRLFSN